MAMTRLWKADTGSKKTEELSAEGMDRLILTMMLIAAFRKGNPILNRSLMNALRKGKPIARKASKRSAVIGRIAPARIEKAA